MKNLQDAILDELAESMRKSMDFVIIADICEAMGWIKLNIEYNNSTNRFVDIVDWINTNCKGLYKEHDGTWLFENAKDATMFALKWRCE